MLSPKWLSRRYPVNLSGNPLSTASQRFGILLLQQTGVSVTTSYPWAFPDWSFIPGSLIAWAGVGFAAICYLTASRRRKWLRLAALVIGVTGATLLAIWLLPAFAFYSSFEVLSVPWGIAIFLSVVACLIILTSVVIGWRRELFGGILLIVGGLIAGVVYPLWLFHISSILTLFPLVSGFLYLLSWRERPRRTTIESVEKEPSQAQPQKSLPHALLISGIVITGPIGLLAVLVYWLNTTFLTSPSFWEAYLMWVFLEVWCVALTCAILARRRYW